MVAPATARSRAPLLRGGDLYLRHDSPAVGYRFFGPGELQPMRCHRLDMCGVLARGAWHTSSHPG